MLKPRANQTKVSTESGIQAVVPGIAGKIVLVWCGVLMLSGDDKIILASGTAEDYEDETGAMPFEASGGFIMPPALDPWFATDVGTGLVVRSENGAEINGWLRWSYASV